MATSVDAKMAPSPQRRASASHPSSVKSGKSASSSSKSPRLASQNETPIPAGAADSISKPAEKAGVKGRLLRIFSTKDAPRGTTAMAQEIASHANGANAPTVSTTNSTAKPPQRGTSVTDKPKQVNGKDVSYQRFVADPDLHGGHEHHLQSRRRQEKLTDMIKGLLGGKKPEHAPDHDLSLVSSWVDTLKLEKDSMAGDKKTGPAAASLVEKYGKCQEVVGRGAFGIVRISHKKMENGCGEKLFAVKEFRRRPEETEKKYSKRLTAEFCISSSLRHPNVIHTLDLLKDAKGDYCEVMEFCAGGDLYTLVLSAGKLEVQEADCFFKQIMRGVEYMHEMGVAHRDLKPENLLLTTKGAIKITDFGNGECFRMAWENDAHMVSGLCGSAPYIAPEEYIDKEFDARAVDVWACGVIYMAMRTGRHLWRVAKKDDDEFYDRYLEGRKDEAGYAPIESLHRARCRNVIYSILDPNPGRRITATQVLKSEWGREIKLCKAGEEGL